MYHEPHWHCTCIWTMISCMIIMGLHLGASLPSTISVGQEQRHLGKAWLTLSKEPRMPTLHKAIMASSKSFICTIISSLNCAVCTCTFNVCNRQESHHQCKLQVAQGLVLVRFVLLCKLQLVAASCSY